MCIELPKIDIAFAHEDSESGRTLCCLLYNRPTKNKFLIKLGICKRTEWDVFTVFHIWDCESEQYIAKSCNAALQRDSKAVRRIILPASDFPVTVKLIQAISKQEAHILERTSTQTLLHPIGEGLYLLDITVLYGAEQTKATKVFHVGANPTELQWVQASYPHSLLPEGRSKLELGYP